MPVIIAHGQPKSGSTFLFETAKELREIRDGDDHKLALRECLGPRFHPFQPRIDRPLLEDILAKAGDRTLVIKTHGALDGEVRSMIESGRIRAFTSFRDPRDACLSMLDAGVLDRAKGRTRWFATKTMMQELIEPILYHLKDLEGWIACPPVLAIPYYLIAHHQDHAVRLLCAHLGQGALGSVVAARMQARKSTVVEFNKGVTDRFLTGFSTEEIGYLNTRMAPQIQRYERLLARKMIQYGHRLLYCHLIAIRNRELALHNLLPDRG